MSENCEMTRVTVQLDEQTNAALEAVAQRVGSPPEQVAADLLRDSLTGLDTSSIESLQVKRAVAGVLVDRSPWNNPIDAEWDNFQP